MEIDNPKKAMGDLKPCVHYAPMSVMLQVAEVMRGGAKKYGVKNWRAQPIKVSTYYDAMFRHLTAWFEDGRDLDDESGQPHLAHIIACAMLLMDSQRLGILVDDRHECEVLTKDIGA